ncbi:hypothetical protein Acr_00g0031420 [Actinidia rufa]|uniref:Uncharacterized protein n=1 Tax=Actinidia rufa TaxID=165716 RepID=A0A7J0DGC4_9ERIC|nr:hypothetical protein Acr_00g0031420 [Actinidia rufa]
MSCDEFRCLYSLSLLPDSRWYYFKARLDKDLLSGSPSNVKGWKKRFFFTFRDEWEFFSSMPPSMGIPRVPRSWGALEKSFNKLSALTENEAKRTAEVLEKIGPGGYFEVSKVLGSKTFKKCFARDRMEVSSSGGENNTSGDEGESRLYQGDLQRGSPSRSNSVEYLGVIRGDIGRISRKVFPDTPDLTLLRWLGGKVQAMSSQISLSTLTKKAGENKAATKDASSAATSQPPLKGIIIQEKHSREDMNNFKDAVIDSAATYFNYGFEFYKRQLLYHYPNLVVDLAGMEMDTD